LPEKLFRLEFKPGWDVHFAKFDNSVQQLILKKFEKMKQPLVGRGLHSTRYLVEEVGQYRIAYIEDSKRFVKMVHFVGNHKQYEKWYKSTFR